MIDELIKDLKAKVKQVKNGKPASLVLGIGSLPSRDKQIYEYLFENHNKNVDILEEEETVVITLKSKNKKAFAHICKFLELNNNER